MAKLYLKFEQAMLKEVGLSQGVLTIGRLPDNVLQIDNLAVSGHHAKIYWEQNHYTLEDLGSLNGTYVNNQRVGKAALKEGDQIVIGKHLLQFKDDGQKVPTEQSFTKLGPATPNLEATVTLDTKKAQEMISSSAPPAATGPLGLSRPAAPTSHVRERMGILAVLEGKAEHEQYVLTGKMTMIGKSDMATIKLKGFFAPRTAALISRRDNKYFVAASGEKVKVRINGAEIAGQHELKEGDVLEVANLKASFGYQD
ncbi:MAG TPA: FHA domain-containing protein [Candidatus Saccharimonadales bacterium]|jgi:pSer/pThr/pTyr-binding forkhead associated (FHA) protein|nr:FHA domain-containing protein [Candidatus Saccharimonadales bacterium]